MAAPPLPAKSTLQKVREIQAWQATEGKPSPGATAPDYCLAASRFMVGKLAGLFPAERHLNNFLKDEKASRSTGLDDVRLKLAWGKFSSSSRKELNLRKDFNEVMLPAAVAWGKQGFSPDDVEYVDDEPGKADQLLALHVPLVVGGAFSPGGSVEHYIALVTDRVGTIWLIDPWDADKAHAVEALKAGSTLTRRFSVTTNAGTMYFPAGKPYVGYYRQKSTQAPLTLRLVL